MSSTSNIQDLRSKISNSYRAWLSSKSYSDSTIRNYLSDLYTYFDSVGQGNPFDSKVISDFVNKVSANSNYRRYLASLSSFCQFALDQKLIDHNPLKKIRHSLASPPPPTPDALISQFATYLSTHHATPSTIKNYISDLRQYITWTNSQPTN
ncbi:MAG: site-specific integrase [Candidatus Shapirobacteria bacterium]|jgi:site-specific recombinase XerD